MLWRARLSANGRSKVRKDKNLLWLLLSSCLAAAAFLHGQQRELWVKTFPIERLVDFPRLRSKDTLWEYVWCSHLSVSKVRLGLHIEWAISNMLGFPLQS